MRDDEAGDLQESIGDPEPTSSELMNLTTRSVAASEQSTITHESSILNRTVRGRPLMVYLVLFAGAATLFLLLFIVWFSGRNDGTSLLQFCSPISAAEAKQAILAGDVTRMTVLVDQENPLNSLTGMRLEFSDATCREPQQGADYRDDLYLIIGAAEFFNTFGEQRVDINYQRQNIPVALLSTSTPIPTATLPPTETSTPTSTPEVTATATPSITPTATQSEPATPTLMPSETPTGSPAATLTLTLSETSTQSPSATAAPTRTPTSETIVVPASPDASPDSTPSRTATPHTGTTPSP